MKLKKIAVALATVSASAAMLFAGAAQAESVEMLITKLGGKIDAAKICENAGFKLVSMTPVAVSTGLSLGNYFPLFSNGVKPVASYDNFDLVCGSAVAGGRSSGSLSVRQLRHTDDESKFSMDVEFVSAEGIASHFKNTMTIDTRDEHWTARLDSMTREYAAVNLVERDGVFVIESTEK